MNASKSQPNLIERKPYILAIAITVLLVIWMASGMLGAETKTLPHKQEEQQKRPSVETTLFVAQPVHRSIELYGRTEPDRILSVESEVEGRVAKILIQEGELVKKGQVLVELAIEDKLEQVNFAKSLVKQREIEFKGAQSLQSKGLQGESLLAQAEAALVEAKALLKLRQAQLEKSTIKAAFDGVVTNQAIELGSFVNKGQALFDLVDLSPLVVSAHVTENYVNQITPEALVEVVLVDGSKVPGKIRYLASVSEMGTNTFPIEIEIDNPEQKMKAGISTEIDVLFAEELAIKVSPALLSLDKDGNLGVKTVVDEQVVFTPIDMIKAEQDGVWLAGFEQQTHVITRGQGFVRPGDKVNATLKQAGE